MKVSEIMNKAIVVEENIRLKDAAQVMSDKRIGSLIIMKKEKIIGIITERDVLKNIGKLNSEIYLTMSKNVVTIESNDSVDNASLIMAKYKIKRLPVLSNNKLVGIITATDILANSDSLNESFLIE